MTAPRTSRRELAKDGRRNRIIDSADELIREIGIDDLSVRMIADRADVSPATVYNLFRNKAAVLGRVYHRRVVTFEARVARTKSDSALDHIFVAAALVADLYRKDPGFYRAFVGMRLDVPVNDKPLRETPGEALWRNLVRDAVKAGDLADDTDADRVGALLYRIITGAFYQWIMNALPIERLESETAFGFAAVLSAWARPAARSRLAERFPLGPEPAPVKTPRLRLVTSGD